MRRCAVPLLLGWISVGLLACGSRGTTPERPPGPGESPRSSASTRVRTIDEPNRPLVRLLERLGDPRGAVAVSVFPEGGSRGALGIAGLLEERLRALGQNEISSSPFGPGVVVTTPVGSAADVSRFFRNVERVLATKVEAGDPAIARANALLGAAQKRAGRASAVDECLGRLGAEGAEALGSAFDASSLDDLRESSHAASRVGFAVLGAPALLEAAQTTQATLAWPEGDALADGFEAGDVLELGSGVPTRQLTVAYRVANASLALGAERNLNGPENLLTARLSALPGEFEAEPVELTFRPRGACLAVTLHQVEGAPPIDLDGWAMAALVARAELGEALEGGSLREDPARAFLAAERAVDAAGLGAWTSLRRTGEPAPDRRLVRLLSPGTERDRPQQAAFERALEKAGRTLAETPLPLTSLSESGQGEAWLLVASPCGTVAETAEEAGLRALTVRSLAADFDGTEGVTLEPWFRADAVGLLAHTAEREGESPEQHGARLARVAALAWAGPELDGREVAAVRSRQLDELGDNPARALIVSLLAGDAPARVEPRGATLVVAESATNQLERVRARLVAEPLRAALLANGSAGQVRSVERTLGAWLAPMRARGEACPRAEAARSRPGIWTLGAASPELRAIRYVGAALSGSSEAGQAWAWLLNRPGGYLERALAAPEFVASAEARFYPGVGGAGALVIALSSEAERLEAVERQIRVLLDTLSRAPLPAAELTAAQAEQRRREQREAESPRGRAVQLWYGRHVEAVSGADLEQAARGMAATQQTVVRLVPQK